MRTVLIMLTASSALAGCTVQTASFYAPIRIEKVTSDERFLVIRNLNTPHDCRVVPESSMYPAIYAIRFGPASELGADRWAIRNCGARR